MIMDGHGWFAQKHIFIMDSILNMVEPVVEAMVEPMVINIITGWW